MTRIVEPTAKICQSPMPKIVVDYMAHFRQHCVIHIFANDWGGKELQGRNGSFWFDTSVSPS